MENRLKGMTVFAEVVASKSFSAAADKLGISKSLASRQVSTLERSLAVKLLNRSTRKLSMTEAGGIFYEHCARILQEAELAERRVTQVQAEPAGVVKMTALPAFAVRHVLPAIADFHRNYPEIQVRLSCNNRTVDLADAGFDLGIRVAPRLPPNLVARTLAVSRVVLCGSPAYLSLHGTPRRIEDLAGHECVFFPYLAPKGIWMFRRTGRKYPVKISSVFETDDMEAARAAIVAGLGIGLLPTHMAGADLRKGDLVPLLSQFKPDPESNLIYLVYLPNRTMPSRVRVLIDFLVARFSPTPPWEIGW
ncbi:MAG: LysR substrate-binding domain-containing protein [Casimicrobiaceae bacterium]